MGWGLLLLLAYPALVVRLAIKRGLDRSAWEWAFFLVVGKLAEALGVVGYTVSSFSGRNTTLIEYK